MDVHHAAYIDRTIDNRHTSTINTRECRTSARRLGPLAWEMTIKMASQVHLCNSSEDTSLWPKKVVE